MMNKAELATAISKEGGVSQRDVSKVLKALAVVVTKELKSDGRILIPDVCTFKTKDQTSRSVRNPRTGEMMTSEGKRVVKITPSKNLADAVKEK